MKDRTRAKHLVNYTINKSGCWIWQGYKDKDGYGRFSVRENNIEKMTRANRWFYTQYVGEIPEGLFVCHTCDNTSCVNPEHLWLGTCKENLEDMTRKGRSNFGERSGKSKLTQSVVDDIRGKYVTGDYLQQELADEYGIAQCIVSDITRGKTWLKRDRGDVNGRK